MLGHSQDKAPYSLKQTAELGAFYETLVKQAQALISDETDLIANLANISALIFNSLADVNWAGFYLFKENELVLGPFQGNVACVRIPMGKGVCGVAATSRTVQRIDNVHDFEGHIACDAASNSELVVPIIAHGKLVGVLDIDSPSYNRFGVLEQDFCEKIVREIQLRIEHQ